jgi:hypothetical protein
MRITLLFSVLMVLFACDSYMDYQAEPKYVDTGDWESVVFFPQNGRTDCNTGDTISVLLRNNRWRNADDEIYCDAFSPGGCNVFPFPEGYNSGTAMTFRVRMSCDTSSQDYFNTFGGVYQLWEEQDTVIDIIVGSVIEYQASYRYPTPVQGMLAPIGLASEFGIYTADTNEDPLIEVSFFPQYGPCWCPPPDSTNYTTTYGRTRGCKDLLQNIICY